MVSWRDSASIRAQDDLDTLLDSSLGFAQQQLSKHGEFFPFAMVVRQDGEIELVGLRPEILGEHPSSADVIAGCYEVLLSQRDRLRAAAVTSDVRLSDQGSDAIHVNLEHSEGPSLSVHLPYATKRFRKTIEYGELRAAESDHRTWVS